MRVVGKFGRLSGRVPVGLRELGFYAAGPLPKAPPAVEVPPVVDWQMLGNDHYGDCGVAGLEHVFMADAAMTGENERFPDSTEAVEFYLRYTNGQDSGVVLATYLAYVRKTGYYGRDVTAFAPVAVHDVPTLQYAIYAYGSAYTGIVVTQAMQRAFASHRPWTMTTVDSAVAGGHCVPAVGYDDEFLYIITWGSVQPVTWPAWHHMSSEAWAVITGELVARQGDARGISLAALSADLDRLDS